MAGKTEFSTDFEKNKKRIDELLKVDQSFDLLYRVVMIGGKKACFYFIDGFCKDEIMEKILEFLYKITPEEMPENAHDFFEEKNCRMERSIWCGRKMISCRGCCRVCRC